MSMFNLFRVAGDFLHLFSFLLLLLKIHTTKSCRGISLKTQALYALVFVTRYLDLAWNFSSLYNYIFKILFITLSCSIVYVMKYEKPYCRTYEPLHDNFNVLILIIPCIALAFFFNNHFTFSEVLWTFSIYLEAVAIIPQLVVIHYTAKETGGFVDALNSHYVFALGGYRALYLLNWVYRLMTEDNYSNWIVWIAGLVQTAIYCDFFYYYIRAQVEGKAMALPI